MDLLQLYRLHTVASEYEKTHPEVTKSKADKATIPEIHLLYSPERWLKSNWKWYFDNKPQIEFTIKKLLFTKD